jgi:hypothetical protein
MNCDVVECVANKKSASFPNVSVTYVTCLPLCHGNHPPKKYGIAMAKWRLVAMVSTVEPDFLVVFSFSPFSNRSFTCARPQAVDVL